LVVVERVVVEQLVVDQVVLAGLASCEGLEEDHPMMILLQP